MSIRQMLPIGTHLRQCVICQAQITAASDEWTAHEGECLRKLLDEVDEMLKENGAGDDRRQRQPETD